jgi:dTDP-glucose 4,6-dehydratase
MRILVTGGLGFIGSNFILHVLEKYPDFRVTNVDAELPGSNKKNLENLHGNTRYEYVKGNITNKRLIEKLVSKSDAVINFAAESHVDRSINSPKPFLDSNIIGAFTILEAVRKFKKRLVQISTDEVFGSLKRGSADEKYPFNPSSPYASSKASAELLVKSYVTTYGCDAIITRCTNNYGPKQSPEKLIPKTIILAHKNKKIPIYGSGKNVRDWIYVLDHCNAVMKIFLEGKSGESYNISADNEVNNIAIVKKILKLMDKTTDLIYFTKDRPGHDFRYSLNSKKIRKELHWKTSYDFEQGLEFTIKWYLDNKRWWKNAPPSILKAYNWKTR